MGFREPLLIPLAALAFGIVASQYLDFPLRTVLVGIALLLALALLAYRFVSVRASLLALGGCLFLLGILADLVHRPGPPPKIDFESGETLSLAGCVVEPPALSLDREQFVLELAPGARARVNWYLKPGETAPELHYGNQIEFDAKLRSPHNFGNPGSFDFTGYLARNNIYWLASASGKSRLKVQNASCGSALLRPIYRLRETAVARLDKIFDADSYALGMSRAVLLGDSARLERIWADDYRRTGTYHAIVISGIHLTVLAACFLFIFKMLGAPAMAALATTTGLCWVYALMTGSGAPVIRSAAGLTLFLVARWFYRRARILNILAAVAMLFLVVDPGQLFDASFQLSFLSVALIGAVAAPLLECTTEPYAKAIRQLANTRLDPRLSPELAEFRVEVRLLAETVSLYAPVKQAIVQKAITAVAVTIDWVWTMFLISGIVQIGMLLPMVLFFHRLSLTGLTANVFIIPAMNLLVPIGFLAIVTGSALFSWPARWLLAISRGVTAWHVQWEPGWRIPDPPLWCSLLFLAALIVLAASLRFRRLRLVAAAGFSGAAMLIAGHPFPRQLDTGWLEVTAVDVGQGESLFIAAPDGRLMLFDTGGVPVFGKQRRPTLDIGEEVVSPYLFTRSIKSLDILALSHAHEDHVGGLVAIIRNFRPREVWVGAFPETEAWQHLRAAIESTGARVVTPKAGERQVWGGTKITFVSPPRDYEPAPTPKNNDSLAFEIRYGTSTMLLTGDIERQMEMRMLRDGLLSHVDVLKIPHHGSKTSSTAPFLEATQPTWAVISAGADNMFRHPHPDVLKRLGNGGTRIWRTDQSGQVRFLTDGKRWVVEPYRLPGFDRVTFFRRPLF